MRLLVCGVDFGWGSAGKLSAILQELRARSGAALHVTGIGTTLGRRIIPNRLVDTWLDADMSVSAALSLARPDAAMVVLDPHAADALTNAGCPVVYVDSLPYLWTEHDPVPCDVTRYCAQRTLPIPPHAARVLARVPALEWIDPIVPPSLTRRAQRQRDDQLLLVNIGGFHAPLATSSASDYLSLVLRPVVEAAARRGARRLLLAGNVTAADVPSVETLDVELLDGSHPAFLDALQRARWIVTSPGLTTLLEIAALGRSAVLLPPQNLSQFHHLRHAAATVGAAFTMPWPRAVLDPEHVASWQRHGEDHALARIYEAIVTAAAAPSDELVEGLRAAARRAFDACEHTPAALQTMLRSSDGAQQVADSVLSVLTRDAHARSQVFAGAGTSLPTGRRMPSTLALQMQRPVESQPS